MLSYAPCALPPSHHLSGGDQFRSIAYDLKHFGQNRFRLSATDPDRSHRTFIARDRRECIPSSPKFEIVKPNDLKRRLHDFFILKPNPRIQPSEGMHLRDDVRPDQSRPLDYWVIALIEARTRWSVTDRLLGSGNARHNAHQYGAVSVSWKRLRISYLWLPALSRSPFAQPPAALKSSVVLKSEIPVRKSGRVRPERRRSLVPRDRFGRTKTAKLHHIILSRSHQVPVPPSAMRVSISSWMQEKMNCSIVSTC